MNNLEELKKKYAELGAEIERLEKQKENKRWRAEKNEEYYYIDTAGEIDESHEANDIIDDFRYKTRNYFKTEQEAQEHLDKINTYWELMDLAEELNNGEEIDWEDDSQVKNFIEYNHDTEELREYYSWNCKEIGNIYFLNENFLEIAKERIGEERLIKLFE